MEGLDGTECGSEQANKSNVCCCCSWWWRFHRGIFV